MEQVSDDVFISMPRKKVRNVKCRATIPIQPSNTIALGRKFSVNEFHKDTATFQIEHSILKIFTYEIIIAYLRKYCKPSLYW